MAAIGLFACQSEPELPIGPGAAAPSFVEVNGVKLVTLQPGRSLAPAGALERVTKKLGTVLTSGDATFTVPPGAVKNTTQIWMQPDDVSGFMQFTFGPSGTTFNPAATLTISAVKANLEPSQKNRLRIAGASDNADNWTIVGGVYDPATDTVTASISHFSRYALCVE
jgi:hypothetical protein